MLRLVPHPTFKAPVRISVPGAEPAALTVEFRHKSRQGLADWFAASKDKPFAAALAEVIVGWDGVHDESGEAVACTEDALAVLLANYAQAGNELLAAYVAQLTESRAKN